MARVLLQRSLSRLRRHPTYIVLGVVQVALGVGSVCAASLINQALFMPGAGIPDFERVVNIYHWPFQRGAQSPRLSWPDTEELRANTDLFVDSIAWARLDKPVTGMGRFRMADGELVSSNYFAFVGAQPVIGRVLQPSDHVPAAAPVAVIGEQLWRSAFGASPETIGRSFQIGRQRFTIVGVIDDRFRGLDLPNIQPTKLWIPIEFAEAVGILSPNGWINADERWVMVKAKLTRGVTAAAAQWSCLSTGGKA